MKETLTLNCTRTFFGSPYHALRILPVCFVIIVFWKTIFPNISLFSSSMGAFIFVVLSVILTIFINKIVFLLYKKTTIETIHISSTGIELIQPKINRQSLFLWSNIQSIKYIYHHASQGIYYHEKISIKTKDKQAKTFVFELDAKYKKQQDRLHENIYQILKQYTEKHQIDYKHNHTDDAKFANSSLGNNTLFIVEVITLLLLTILIAIISIFAIPEINFSKINFDILLGILFIFIIFILWFINLFLVVKGIKRLLK